MKPDSPENPPEESGHDGDEIPLPIGTLFLMMIFLMVMAGMWLAMYFEFLGR
ncbi:hypothetical protein BH23GEM11_BH23GEM11_20090 [soil metagenome]